MPNINPALLFLQNAVEAKQQFVRMFGHLEREVGGESGFNSTQLTFAREAIDALAAGSTSIGDPEMTWFLERIAVGMPAPPRPATTLSYEQFVMAYEAHMRQGGTSIQLGHVDSSWHAYQKDPAGHFISRTKPAPKFTVGQKVYVVLIEDQPIEWSGKIISVADVGLPDETQYEYHVEGAPTKGSGEFPLMAWESQLRPMFDSDGTMLDSKGNRSIFDDLDE